MVRGVRTQRGVSGAGLGGFCSLCGCCTHCRGHVPGVASVPMSRGCGGAHQLCPWEGAGPGPPLCCQDLLVEVAVPAPLPSPAFLHRLKTITINQKPSPGLSKVLGTQDRSLSILNNNALELPAPRWLHLHDAKNQ